MTKLENKLKVLRDYILVNINPFVGKYGVVIERGKEQLIKTVTDEYDNYFYLDYLDGDGQISFDYASNSGQRGLHIATGNFKLVARFTGYNLNLACDALVACILNQGGELLSLSTDEKYIFETETNEEIKCELDLVRIEFALECPVRPEVNCFELLCKDESC